MTKGAIVVGVGAIAIVVLSNAYVLVDSGGEATADVDEVPRTGTAIVPGALVNSDGTMSTMLDDRVRRALSLWRAGKVERILVSGDHGAWAYDEPGTMRRALVAAGVPGRVIFEDHAGFDTWATMQRARAIFGVDDAVIVTQGFHMSRALFLADAAGLDATGFVADLHPYGAQGRKSDVREVLSRVKAVADVAFGTAAIGGEVIPIEGDGRESWGPAAPRGTQPSGAPTR